MSLVADIFDRYLIDGAINGIAWLSKKSGEILRRGQTGYVQTYVGVILLGACLLILFLIIFGGGS